MKKINVVIIVIFILLGVGTFFGMDKVNPKSDSKAATSKSENTAKSQDKSKFNYRGYEVNILGQFGQEDKVTTGRYIIGTPNESLAMFEVITHDWEDAVKDTVVWKKEYQKVLHRKSTEMNVEGYYFVRDKYIKNPWDNLDNSVLLFDRLDDEREIKCPFALFQVIRFYDSQEIYEKNGQVKK